MLKVFEPNMGWRESLAVARQVWSRRVSPGEKVAEFETMLCAETGAKYAVCCNSGTTALMLAMLTDSGRLTSVPSYTFSAAANIARLLGRDVEQWDIGSDLQMRRYISRSGRAVVLVAHNGQTCWGITAELFDDCNVILDASQALGLLAMTARTVMATLSFSGPKIVTTGAGGAVVTNSRRVADVVRGFCDHGGGQWRKTRIHEGPGGNFRMSDVNAALGVAQMKRLPELLGIRRERFAWYRRHFPEMPTDGWCCLVRTTKAKECIAALRAAGYEALQPYRPLQESIPYRHLPVDPEAVKAADELLYLGNHWRVRRRDVDAISTIIKRIDPCATGN